MSQVHIKTKINGDNLEFLCYNCSFLYAASPIEEKQAEQMEDYVEHADKEFDWELDNHHIEHLKELGLYEDDKEDGSERPTLRM